MWTSPPADRTRSVSASTSSVAKYVAQNGGWFSNRSGFIPATRRPLSKNIV